MIYEIKYEPVVVNGEIINKYNIYYYDREGNVILKEFHSFDGISGSIREGYIKYEPSNNARMKSPEDNQNNKIESIVITNKKCTSILCRLIKYIKSIFNK